ncbi:MAG: DUF3078 domain-containing protein [Myxococcota bacterium]
MSARRVLSRAIPFLAASVVTASASAAPDPKILPTEGEIKKLKEEVKAEDPWDPSLVFGLNIALATSNDVVGQADGLSLTAGLNIQGGLNYTQGAIDWRNTLKLNELYTRTPVLDELVKSGDLFEYESILYYLASKIWGPFVSFKLDTALLKGFDVRPAPVDYTLDGLPYKTGVDRTKLTDSFQPLALKEAVGAFVNTVTGDDLSVNIRAGFGAAETFAKGGKVLADDGGTPAIELASLADVIQAGAVVGVEAHGDLDEKHVTYTAHAEVLFPIINDDPDNRGVIDLTNIDVGARLSFKLFSFATLDYELKVMRQPQLVDAWQISNSLLLNFTYTAVP